MLYVCIPMAVLIELAGGMATDGRHRILDLLPSDFHQRTAIFIGSKEMVEKAMSFMQAGPVS